MKMRQNTARLKELLGKSVLFLYFAYIDFYYMFSYLKNYHLFNSKDQAIFRKALDEEVVLPLNIHISKRAAEVAVQQKHVEFSDRNYAIASESLDRAKVRHRKLVEDIKRVHSKLSKKPGADNPESSTDKKNSSSTYFGRMFSAFDSSAEMERDKLVRKLERLKIDCAASYSEIMLKKNVVVDTMLSLDRAEENVSGFA
jgi:hypothetical protein